MRKLLLSMTLAALGLWVLPAGVAFAGENAAADLYKKHCQICHAKDGSGKTTQGEKTKTVDWRDGTIWAKVDDATSKTIILEGKGEMKGYKDKVPADQVDALLAYCKPLTPATPEATPPAAP